MAQSRPSVPEAAALVLPDGDGDRVAVEVGERALVVVEHEVGEVHREAVAGEDPLDGEVLAVRRQCVRGDLPARGAEAVGEVEEREAVIDTVAELPGEARDAAVAVVDDLEWAELRDLGG